MAGNKTIATRTSVTAFIAELPEARRADAQALVKLLRKVTGEKPVLWGTAIIGFGSSHYKYQSGREGDMPLIGFSPRKSALVLYGAIGFVGADALLSRLGKHTLGKGCLYLKQLADADPPVLETLLARAFATRIQR